MFVATAKNVIAYLMAMFSTFFATCFCAVLYKLRSSSITSSDPEDLSIVPNDNDINERNIYRR